jgi:hypothetical protein
MLQSLSATQRCVQALLGLRDPKQSYDWVELQISRGNTRYCNTLQHRRNLSEYKQLCCSCHVAAAAHSQLHVCLQPQAAPQQQLVASPATSPTAVIMSFECE